MALLLEPGFRAAIEAAPADDFLSGLGRYAKAMAEFRSHLTDMHFGAAQGMVKGSFTPDSGTDMRLLPALEPAGDELNDPFVLAANIDLGPEPSESAHPSADTSVHEHGLPRGTSASPVNKQALLDMIMDSTPEDEHRLNGPALAGVIRLSTNWQPGQDIRLMMHRAAHKDFAWQISDALGVRVSAPTGIVILNHATFSSVHGLVRRTDLSVVEPGSIRANQQGFIEGNPMTVPWRVYEPGQGHSVRGSLPRHADRAGNPGLSQH